MKRKVYCMALSACFTLVFATAGFAGQWKQEGSSWYYEQDGYRLNNGWNQIDGKWYYFKDSGIMAADETIDGYYVSADGSWQEGTKRSYENEGDSVADIITNYLTYDTKYSITLEELVNKNRASYTAGTGSVYGKALNQAELNQVAQEVHRIVTTYITQDMNEVQKADILYTYLMNTCKYAPTWSANRANTAWGALIYKEAQCSGYARAFKALCDAVDIPCYYVHANEQSVNPSHQWNIIQIEGNWYHVDTQGQVFLVSDRLMAGSGLEWNRAEFPACPASYLSFYDTLDYLYPYRPTAEWLYRN